MESAHRRPGEGRRYSSTFMSIAEQAILDRVNADNWALLYRCRWSKPDAEHVVPQRCNASLGIHRPEGR